MLASQIPAKFNIPFANNAAPSFINPIPLPSQIGITGGAASLFDGFPPITFVPVGAGGIPPWGRDFNGLFNQITAWSRWQAAGGQVTFDATFASAIGGYPVGALLAATAAGNMWASTTDNNVTNPDTTPGAPGWAGVAFITPVQNSAYVSADDTGSADIYVAAPLPPPSQYQKYQRFQVKIANANATTTPTLNIAGVSGLLGAKTIIHPDGSALAKGELSVGMIAPLVYDGTRFQLETGRGAGAGGGSGLINVQVLLASGTYTPTPGATKALVFATGGGGGGGSQVGGQGVGGAGGGAGSTAIALVAISGPVSCLVGNGGAGGAQAPVVGTDNSVGAPGGTTSFGSFAVAGGGGGGGGFVAGIGGPGGVASVGLMLIPGGDGTSVKFGSTSGGGSYWGSGGAANNSPAGPNTNGFPGRAYGSGGGGCDSGTTGTSVGGRGASGVILILEF